MKHLLRDLDNLKRDILVIGSLVESALTKASTALIESRQDLAKEVIEGDAEIDRREVDLENDCLKVLALHQPVAADLRFVVAVLKVNNDLERMGDLAGSIAGRTLSLIGSKQPAPAQEFRVLVDCVIAMVRGSLDSLVNQDKELARKVCKSDDEVDRMHRENIQTLQAKMIHEPTLIPEAVCSLTISRALERIADLATNIAEDVLFMIDGEILRHRDEF